MEEYDVQQVCLNGHQITDMYLKYPEYRKKFCEKCGEPTIVECPNCKKPIRGCHFAIGVLNIGSAAVPSHCHDCGKPFPWTERRKELSGTAEEKESRKSLSLIELICRRFHLVAKQLRDRRQNRPTLDISDEFDVQDLLHALLRLYFDDIRPEEWTPSYAGKCARMDFFLKDESVIIEAKKTRSGLNAGDIGDQLIEDIQRYKQHPDCKILFCFVYDPEGRIANPQGLENDLTRKENDLDVKVFVVPKGY